MRYLFLQRFAKAFLFLLLAVTLAAGIILTTQIRQNPNSAYAETPFCAEENSNETSEAPNDNSSDKSPVCVAIATDTVELPPRLSGSSTSLKNLQKGVDADITSVSGFSENTTFYIEVLPNEVTSTTFAMPNGKSIFRVYNATLYVNGKVSSLAGSATIRMAVPEGLTEAETYTVLTVENGETVRKTATAEDGYLSFSTTTLGEFALLKDTDGGINKLEIPFWIWIIIGGVLLVVAIIIIVIACKREYKVKFIYAAERSPLIISARSGDRIGPHIENTTFNIARTRNGKFISGMETGRILRAYFDPYRTQPVIPSYRIRSNMLLFGVVGKDLTKKPNRKQ